MHKRFFLLLITAILAILVNSGCHSQNETWQRIAESGVLRVGLDPTYPPFEVADGSGNVSGLDVDLAHALQKQFPTRKMPLLLLTSLGQQDEAMKQAFTGILTKPVKPSRLHEMFLATFSEGYSARQREQTQGMSAFAPFSQSLRILLAEDNRINQKVGLRMLAKFGCRADVAANGLEVLDALVRQPYDIVLMDINMPEMDGVETTQLIIERYGEKRPYIIALTANALAGDREVYLESGMDDYLSKPIKLEALLQILQKAVKVMNVPKRATLHVV